MNFLSIGTTLAAVRTSTGVSLFHAVESPSTGLTSINMFNSVDASCRSFRPRYHISVSSTAPHTRITAHTTGAYSISVFYQTKAGSIERLVITGEGQSSRTRVSDVVVSRRTTFPAPLLGTSLASAVSSAPHSTLEFLFYQAIDERIYYVYRDHRHSRRGWSIPYPVSDEQFSAPISLSAFHWTETHHDTVDCIGVALNSGGLRIAIHTMKQSRSSLKRNIVHPAFRGVIRNAGASFSGPFIGLHLAPLDSAAEFRFYGQWPCVSTSPIMQCTTHYDAPRSQAPRTYRALGADGHDGKNSDHLKPTVNGPLAVLNRAIHHGMKPDIVLFYITEGGDIAATNVSYSHDQRDEIFVPFIIESSSVKPKYLNEPVHVENMDDLDPHTHFNEMDIVPSIDPAVQISMRSHLFALIIGIDKYKHSSSTLPNLSGAVRDAKAIKTYLEDRMNVPSSRIRTLLNEDATRRAILDEVVNLKTNNAIIKNDPILIYYAGHGAEVASPEDWEAGGKDAKIQMIIPHDYVEGEKDPQAPHGIPDRTIAILLDNLADAKGNNITVIFDSCFAGSGTRAIHEDSSARGFVARRPVSPNLDREILSVTRVIGPCPGFATHGLRSHVFLAACRSGETAHESHEGGDFTVALLRTLQNLGPSEQLSYKALVQRLAPLLSRQNPVCEGVYQNWVLFSPRKGSTRRTYALHKVVVVNGVITMQAGSAHGVSEGSEYAIHEHNTINSLTLGRFIASQPGTFETRLNYTDGFHVSSIPLLAYAVQTYASRSPDDSALKVYVPEDFPFVPLHEALVEASRHCPPGHRTFLTTPTRSEADVGLEHNGGHRVRVALLKDRDPSNSLKYASIHLTLDDPTQRTIRVLRSAAHFYWYLRHHTHKGKAFQSKVLMSCFQLQEYATLFDNQEQLCLKPSPGGRNIIVDDRIDITVNENDKYGFELINTTKVSLYPYLFYFNKSDFSIEPLYIPSTGAEPPLAAGDGRLTIGYGAGGASPISWSVSNGQNLEDGSLKLIVATTYMELSDMPQASEDSAGHKLKRTSLRPEPSHVPRTPVLQRPREMVLVQSPRHDLWWEVTIPVVQRRPPHG